MHCHTDRGQWAVEFLQCTATLPGGQGLCLSAWGQWAVEALSCTATLLRGSGQCNSCNALPRCLGAVASATPAMHCHTTRGRWAVELLQCAGPPAGGTGSPAQEAVAA